MKKQIEQKLLDNNVSIALLFIAVKCCCESKDIKDCALTTNFWENHGHQRQLKIVCGGM